LKAVAAINYRGQIDPAQKVPDRYFYCNYN